MVPFDPPCTQMKLFTKGGHTDTIYTCTSPYGQVHASHVLVPHEWRWGCQNESSHVMPICGRLLRHLFARNTPQALHTLYQIRLHKSASREQTRGPARTNTQYGAGGYNSRCCKNRRCVVQHCKVWVTRRAGEELVRKREKKEIPRTWAKYMN